jgi:hypothetical protein
MVASLDLSNSIEAMSIGNGIFRYPGRCAAESAADGVTSFERLGDLIPHRLHEIGHHRPGRGLEEGFDRHAGDELRAFQARRIWRTLGHFKSLLPSPPFLRLGRSLIINCDRLPKVETPSRAGGQITLEGMVDPLVLGRTAAARLREVLASEKG